MSESIFDWIASEIVPHEAAVRRWMRHALPAKHDEDDLVQEAYSRIARRRDFSAIRSGRAYFFTVVRNLVLEQLRRERVVTIQELAAIDVSRIVDSEPLADRVMMGREQLALTMRALDELPARTRNVFRLRRIDGLSQRETAGHLRISENIVEKEVARALRFVLAQFERLYGDYVPEAQEAVEDDARRYRQQD